MIPSVRGHSRSLPVEKVIAEVNTLVASGYKELVISGINLGRWGRDLARGPQVSDRRDAPTSEVRGPMPIFEDLLRAILAETQLEKLRISSVEPMDWTDDLISLVASSPRIARHAHVPLQSASDAVLRRMHRKYRPWHYREKIEKIRAAMPTAAIGADVMVGFPGESDAEFECTRRFIQELPFTYLHVFTYSARPGTAAAAMPNQVPIRVARARNKILRDLAAEKKLAFMQNFIGKSLDAITLNIVYESPAGERTEALTDNYQKLYLRGHHQANRWITARIEEVQNEALVESETGPSAPANCKYLLSGQESLQGIMLPSRKMDAVAINDSKAVIHSVRYHRRFIAAASSSGCGDFQCFAQDELFYFRASSRSVDDFSIVPELHAKLLWTYNLRGGPL